MENKIKQKLSEIALDDEIQILSGREMGSRLMGVAHEGSDWDIMFIYSFDEAWKYPALEKSRETMDFEEGEMDFHGWNLNKFAKLLQDSNPQAMEFLAAEPYTERHSELWRRIEEDAFENFNHMALYHHYISLAKSNYTKYIENNNDRTAGRQFYVARALACASHIRRDREFPPMDAMHLAEDGKMNDELRGLLKRFTEAKIAGFGDAEQPDLIGPLYEAESEAPMEPSDERTNSPDAERTNKLFKAALRQ